MADLPWRQIVRSVRHPTAERQVPTGHLHGMGSIFFLCFGAGYGNRTRLCGLGSDRSTDELTLHWPYYNRPEQKNQCLFCRRCGNCTNRCSVNIRADWKSARIGGRYSEHLRGQHPIKRILEGPDGPAAVAALGVDQGQIHIAPILSDAQVDYIPAFLHTGAIGKGDPHPPAGQGSRHGGRLGAADIVGLDAQIVKHLLDHGIPEEHIRYMSHDLPCYLLGIEA